MIHQELITELYLLFHCDKCNVILEDNSHWIESDWLDLCDNCYNKEFAFCDNCNEDYIHKDMILINELEQYCKYCYKELKDSGEL